MDVSLDTDFPIDLLPNTIDEMHEIIIPFSTSRRIRSLKSTTLLSKMLFHHSIHKHVSPRIRNKVLTLQLVVESTESVHHQNLESECDSLNG